MNDKDEQQPNSEASEQAKPAEVECLVMRRMSPRYMYPEDRFDFKHWVKVRALRGDRYWTLNRVNGNVTLEIKRRGVRMAFALHREDLELCQLGWRWVVANALRQIRRELYA